MIQVTFSGSADEIAAQIAQFTGRFSAPAKSEVSSDKPAAPQPEPKKRGRPAKAEVKAAEPEPEAQEEVAVEEPAEEVAPAAEPEKVYSVDDVRQVVGKYVKAHDIAVAQEDMKKLMDKLAPGVPNISGLDRATPAARAAIIAALEAALASGERLQVAA